MPMVLALAPGFIVNPKQYPDGIEYVLINGKLVLEERVHTGALPGKVLKSVVSRYYMFE